MSTQDLAVRVPILLFAVTLFSSLFTAKYGDLAKKKAKFN